MRQEDTKDIQEDCEATDYEQILLYSLTSFGS